MNRAKNSDFLRQLMVRGGAIIWLVAVWTLLWGEASALILGSGILVAIAVIVFLPLPRVPVGSRVRISSLIILCFIIASELVTCSIQLAWYAIRPQPIPERSFQWVKLRLKSDLVLTLAVLAMNLIPGTVVLSIDRVHRRVQVHLIPCRSEADIRKFRRQTAKLEYWFSRAFEQGPKR